MRRVPSCSMVLRQAPPARLERATYGFEGLLLGTPSNRRFRPTDYPLGTLPKWSPYAVSGLDNSILQRLSPDKPAVSTSLKREVHRALPRTIGEQPTLIMNQFSLSHTAMPWASRQSGLCIPELL